MPRKKMSRKTQVSSKKTSTKRTVKTKGQSLTSDLEKYFKQAPLQIAALFGKDLTSLKAKEKKLQAKLKKLQAAKKKSLDKETALSQKSTPATKKQLITLKKSSSQLDKDLNGLNRELEQINKESTTLSHNQSKYIAIGKQLTKFEKEFNATAKQKLTPSKNKTKKTEKKPIDHSMNAPKPTMEEQNPSLTQETDIAEMEA